MLIGTMLSLRKLLLHSNQIIELPGSLCLLTALETLDVHKNMISALPHAIGMMKALQKLDLSENMLGAVGARAILTKVAAKDGVRVDLSDNRIPNSQAENVVGKWLWTDCELAALTLGELHLGGVLLVLDL